MEDTDAALYATLKPSLEEIEKVRLEKLAVLEKRKKLALPIGAVITIICAPIDWILLSGAFRNDDGSAAGLTIIALGILWGWVTKPRREYIKTYKEKIMPRLARAACDLEYSLKGFLSMAMLTPSKIVPSFDSATFEDGFKGCYKGTDINFCQLKLTETQGSGKNRRTVIKFQGLVVLLEMNRKFLGHTILVRNEGAIGEWFTKKTKDMMRADLVDPEFEKQFNVYTTDQVEARYLIDPHIMEKLVDMKDHYKGQYITAAYFDGQMLVMIASASNFFEPPDIYLPSVDMESVKMLRGEVAHIAEIIDYLELYDRKQAAAV